MNYKFLDAENLNTAFPNTGTISLQNLSEGEKNKYLSLYHIYRKLFTEYIIQKLNLKQYDDKIANSGLNFPVQSEETMDIYQYFSSDILKYLYIRNNIYVERLTNSEQSFFQEKINNGNYELDLESKEMIEKTFKKVIFEDVMRNENTCQTFFGPDSSSFMARNDALVIGMRYDEFNQNGLSDHEWDQLHDKQLLYLYPLFDELSFKLQHNSDVPISILKYNEFSTRNKQPDPQIFTDEGRGDR